MADIEAVATEKYAGIPLWGWGAGVAAIIVAYAWWRNSQTTATTTTTANTTDTGTVGSDIGDTASGLLPSGTDANYSAPGSTDTGVDESQDWLTQALAAVSGSGVDQYTALQDLTKFMNGSQLTASEEKTIDAAIGAVGLPPGYSSSIAPIASGNVAPLSPDEIAANKALSDAKAEAANAKTAAQKAAAQAKVNAAQAKKLAAQKAAQAKTAATQKTTASKAATQSKALAAQKAAQAKAAATQKAQAKKLAAQKKSLAAEAKKLAAEAKARATAQRRAAKTSAKPSAPKKPATPTFKTYTIHAGDTLSELARKFYPHLSVNAGVKKLAKQNGIANPDLIYVGHTLKY